MGRVTRVNNLQNEFSHEENREKVHVIQLFHVCTRPTFQMNSPRKSLNGPKLDEILELEDERNTILGEISRGIRF